MASREMKVKFVNQPDPERIKKALAECRRITLERRNPGKRYFVTVEIQDDGGDETMQGVRAS